MLSGPQQVDVVCLRSPHSVSKYGLNGFLLLHDLVLFLLHCSSYGFFFHKLRQRDYSVKPSSISKHCIFYAQPVFGYKELQL